MSSGINRKILSEETMKGETKGKGTFNSYASRVTGNANKEAISNGKVGGKKK